MKIAILGDTHFGFKNDSPIFLENYLGFFERQFFPYLKSHGIKSVVHLGDVLDRRKYINFNTLSSVRKRFSEWFVENGVDVHCVIGNHDCYWKNTNEVNSVMEIFKEYFHVYENPKDVMIGGMICGFVPWISKANERQIMDYLSSSNADVVFGHFELTGYEVVRGVKHEGGMMPSTLSRFKKVYSGHFHCRQEIGNIHYLGTPYEMFFSDANEIKGFHILDTDTGELEFVENTTKLFTKVVYDENLDSKGHGNFNFGKFKNTYVRLLVLSKKNQTKFDLFCEKMYEAGIYDMSIVEKLEEATDDDDASLSEEELSKHTIDLIDGYIDELAMDGGYALKSLMRELYTESLSL